MGIRWVRRIRLAVSCVAHAAAYISQADDGSHEFHDAKNLFLRYMKSDQPDERATAIKQFSASRRQATAELLIRRGFVDLDTKVRLETLKALQWMAGDPSVRTLLIDELTKSLRNSALRDNKGNTQKASRTAKAITGPQDRTEVTKDCSWCGSHLRVGSTWTISVEGQVVSDFSLIELN